MIPDRGLTPAYPERAPWGTADRCAPGRRRRSPKYFSREPRDFLAAATPGAGKTAFALRLAAELLSRHTVDRNHGRRADGAPQAAVGRRGRARRGAPSTRRTGTARAGAAGDSHGVVVTYAQVAADAALHRRITESGRTLAILDEVHHGGDALSWGDAFGRRSGRRSVGSRSPGRRSAATTPRSRS